MATDIVGSLFGVSPEMYQEDRNRQGMRDAIAMASLDPMQYANAAIQAGAGRAAGGFAGLMGVEDPQMRLISQRNALAKQFDTNTPQGLLEYSNALQAAGDVQGAALAADRVRSIQGALIKQQADLATTAETRARTGGLNVKAMDRTATINRLMTQFQLGEDEASAVASNPDLVKQYLSPKAERGFELSKTGKYTPESIAKFVDGTGTLELVDMTTKPSEDWLKTARELGLPAKKTFNDYSPAQVLAVNALELQRQLNLRAASAPRTSSVTNLPPQEKAEQSEYGRLLVEQFKNVSEKATLAGKSLPAIDINLNILNKDFETGFGTESKAAGAKVLAALGVQGAEAFATDAQTFLANANSAVLQKQLEQKGPQTASDADRITSTGAQLGNTKEANRFILSVAKAQLQRDIDQRKFYTDWRTEKKTFDGAETAWFAGPGSKSLFDSPNLKKYAVSTSAASMIPGQGSAPAPAIPSAAIDLLKSGKGTDAQFDAIFGVGAAKRVKGGN